MKRELGIINAKPSSSPSVRFKAQDVTDSKSDSAQEIRMRDFELERSRKMLVLQEKAFTFLSVAYSAVLLPTLLILFFQGFHTCGFNLSISLLHLVCAATVGEIAGFTYIMLRFVFAREIGSPHGFPGSPAEKGHIVDADQTCERGCISVNGLNPCIQCKPSV